MEAIKQSAAPADMASLERYLSILARVRRVTHEAVIAGGALRDLYARRPVKDLDIFFPCIDLSAFDVTLKLIAKELGVTYESGAFTQDGIAYSDWNGEVTGVTNLQVDGVDVNLIGLNLPNFTVESVLERIDFGICRVGTDGVDATVHRSFWDDARQQTFTLVRPSDDVALARSVKRWVRLQEKYRGWSLVIPPTSYTPQADAVEEF